MQQVEASGMSKLIDGKPEYEGGDSGRSGIRTPWKSSSGCFNFPEKWKTSH